MKKILILLMVLCTIFITGCGKNGVDKIFKDLTDKINKLDSYTLNGNLTVKNSNNSYNYSVSVSYMAKDKFRVSLINTANNHEQVILRNDEAVFVLTPSLNKSFKFQSDWPYNNSQVYLLGSIIDDLNNDSNVTKEEKDSMYVFTSTVNYPNNPNLVKQRVTVDKDLKVTKVEVLNANDEAEMTFDITNIDYGPTFDESYFEVNSIINTNTNNQQGTNNNNNSQEKDKNTDTENKEQNTEGNENQNTDTNTNTNTNEESSGNKEEQNTNTETTATLDDIIYPLYLPTGTVLEEQEKVSKTDGERVILTFGGEKGFTLVEETATVSKEFTVIPTYGEPLQVNDTIGAVTDNSLNWVSNNVEYYIVSDVMSASELLDIANSISAEATVASLK